MSTDYDPEELFEDLKWELFEKRLTLGNEGMAWFTESFSESDDSNTLVKIFENLTESRSSGTEGAHDADAALGAWTRKLVWEYCMPDEDEVADEVAQVVADRQDRADYERERYLEARDEERWAEMQEANK